MWTELCMSPMPPNYDLSHHIIIMICKRLDTVSYGSLHIVSVSILWPVYVSILRMSPGCKMCASPGHKCALRGCGIAHVSRLWTLSVSILWPVCVSTFRTLGWALCVFRVYISRRWQWNWSSQPAMFVLYVISAANSNFLYQDGQFQFRGYIRFSDIFQLLAEECRIFRYFTIKKWPSDFWRAELMRCGFCKIRTVILRTVTCKRTARLLTSSLNTNSLHDTLTCFGLNSQGGLKQMLLSR